MTKKIRVKAKGDRRLVERHLEEVADENYYEYGVHVIEDRAIFGAIDGLLPVTRRSLWSAHRLGLGHKTQAQKSARVVGDTIGKYHPHGDTACYGAIVTAANSANPLVDGEGNWGSMTDPPAAYRYTNMRLSKLADLMFFDRFYLPVMDLIPNFDGSTDEPLVLPALLPNALLNGNFGIAPGVRQSAPMFTLESVIALVVKAAKSGKVTPAMCAELRLTSKYGGVVKDNPTHKAEHKRLINTGKGKFRFDSTGRSSGNQLRIERFAPFSKIDNVIDKITGVKGVAGVADTSEETDPFKVSYTVTFVKSLTGPALTKTVKQVLDLCSANETYDVRAVDRILDDKGKVRKRLRRHSIASLADNWLQYRIALEKRACLYWIRQRKKDIEHLELMRIAVKHLDTIVKALKMKVDDRAMEAWLAKQIKITPAQARTIFDLQVRRLRRLEDEKLVKQIKELNQEIDGYRVRRKHPGKYIAKDVQRFLKATV